MQITQRAWLLAPALILTSCLRSGGSGGGCGLSADGGVDSLVRSYAGTAVESASGRSEDVTRSTSLRVTRSGTRRVDVDLRGCTLSAEVDGCVGLPEPGQTCSVDLGVIQLTGGTFSFGDATLAADLHFTYTDGATRGTFDYRFSSTPPSGGGASSCRAACEHGRRLGCSSCASSSCEADCAARWSSPLILERMLATEACRVDYGGDTASQCDAP
jgi:hypothetical protein